MIRAKRVSVGVQAAYDAYLQRQVTKYQDYVVGKSNDIGHDLEVAEAATRVVGSVAAAERLGLTIGKTPTDEAITRVGCGCHADTGDSLTRRPVDPNGERTAYQDLVFSVPKSVSVEFAAARAAGDEHRAQQIIKITEGAVEAALRQAQELLPLARRRQGAEGVQVSIPAEMVALFDVHSAARPVAAQTSGDPHLHVHARVLNLCLGEDDKLGSLNYWLLYQNVPAINGIFEAELQARYQDIGYETVTSAHGNRRAWTSFELARQSEPLNERLSSRQTLIEEIVGMETERRRAQLLATIQVANALRLPGGTGREPVTTLTAQQRALCRLTARQVSAISRATREQKLATTRAELADEWRTVVEEFGYEHLPAGESRRADGREAASAEIVRAALTASVNPHMSDLLAGRSVVNRGDILQFVAERAVAAGLDASEVRSTVDQIEAGAVRLEATAHEPLGAFTTPHQVDIERRVADQAIALADEATVGVPVAFVAAALDREAREQGHQLDEEQVGAVRALCGPAGWVQIIGVAGAGKTTVCRPAVAALREAGYQVLGVSLSQAATDVLGSEAGLPAWNLADFTTRARSLTLRVPDGTPVSVTPKTVLLVDEVGTVESQMFAAFMDICREANVAGIRVIGDPAQTQPVGSGSILAWLSRNLPTTYLTTNYRQGDGSHQAVCAQLLREGKGAEFLRAKDQAGELWIDADIDSSVERAVTHWSSSIGGGADVRREVLVADLIEVTNRLNAEARVAYDRLRRLTAERTVIGEREWAVGDRVSFAQMYKVTGPRVAEDGKTVLLRRDGTPRTQTVRTPKRTPGAVVGITTDDAGGAVLQIQTDERGKLESRRVDMSAGDVPTHLDRGYAMTTTIGQGRNWDTTYRVMTVSRLTGRQQEYVGDTRSRRQTLLYADLASVYAEADGEHSARDDAISKYAQLISRDMAKVSTLDYVSAADRAVLEQRLAPRYTRTPALTLGAGISTRQSDYLTALGVTPEDKWSWLRASVEIDRATDSPAGVMAQEWLMEQGVPQSMAWTGIDAACGEAGVKNSLAKPADVSVDKPATWDGAALVDAASRQPRAGTDAASTSAATGVSADVSTDAQVKEQTEGPGSDPPRDAREEIKKTLERIRDQRRRTKVTKVTKDPGGGSPSPGQGSTLRRKGPKRGL